MNAPSFDVRAALYGLVGIDLTQIHGLGSSLALKLVGECGTDLRAWPTTKHFTSWLYLAPGNKISGGKLLSSRTRRSSSRAAALLQRRHERSLCCSTTPFVTACATRTREPHRMMSSTAAGFLPICSAARNRLAITSSLRQRA